MTGKSKTSPKSEPEWMDLNVFVPVLLPCARLLEIKQMQMQEVGWKHCKSSGASQSGRRNSGDLYPCLRQHR